MIDEIKTIAVALLPAYKTLNQNDADFNKYATTIGKTISIWVESESSSLTTFDNKYEAEILITINMFSDVSSVFNDSTTLLNAILAPTSAAALSVFNIVSYTLENDVNSDNSEQLFSTNITISTILNKEF